ncbi:WD repeat-containing protein 43 [Quillaja saponaria]|uniref:WD repeat-containing protein 43 n=1 Tax=Quillaja saponaria TaxID=32244 RepID=A0AAD7PPZ8_QUISA|nr:WD repeat-containing protein 43 [Quillaja saponaria]
MAKEKTKKRRASEPDSLIKTDKIDSGSGEVADRVVEDDLNEPTMGEKLANLNFLDENKVESNEKKESSILVPPSADSVHVLLKQALHADDRVLLLDCLYTQEEKVIAKSISQLSPSNVLKLLHSLISIIQTRGAILACVLPWLKCLLLQHASGIMSQDSSLQALNSLYQLIDSRVSTFQSAIQLSSCLDVLYTGVIDEEVDENQTVPAIFEDNDSEEESEDAMETDQGSEDEQPSANDDSDIEGSDGLISD